MVHTCNSCIQNTEVGSWAKQQDLSQKAQKKRTGNPWMLDLDKNTRFSKAL